MQMLGIKDSIMRRLSIFSITWGSTHFTTGLLSIFSSIYIYSCRLLIYISHHIQHTQYAHDTHVSYAETAYAPCGLTHFVLIDASISIASLSHSSLTQSLSWRRDYVSHHSSNGATAPPRAQQHHSHAVLRQSSNSKRSRQTTVLEPNNWVTIPH